MRLLFSQVDGILQEVKEGRECRMTRMGMLALAALLLSFIAVQAVGGAHNTELGQKEYDNLDAVQWKDVYPREYETWLDGATGWDESVGKPLTMTHAIRSGQRIGAACVSCHSTAFVNMYAEYGGNIVNLTEAELIAGGTETEGIHCYSCHGDRPGELVVSKPYILEAASAGNLDTGDPNLVCAQCHALPNRAYEEMLGSFSEDRTVGAMGNPDANTWPTLGAGTNAEDVYAWYLAHGEKNPKVITGEMEYQQYRGSAMDRAGVTCATCHMEKVTEADGTQYTRHVWQGAHANPAIYENCATCHEAGITEMQRRVLEIQTAYQLKLLEVTGTLNEVRTAILNSDADEEIVAQATDMWFEARFYSSYGQDSSEGIHGLDNPNTDYCFGKCLELCGQIRAILQ